MLKEKMRTDSITHLKAGNKMQLTTLRNVLGEIETREKSGKTPVELTDQQVEAVIRKQVANRRETAATYQANGAQDRAKAETAEADFLDTYLPKQLDAWEAKVIVTTVVHELAREGELTKKDMGRVMKLVNEQVAGRFEGKALSTMVRELLP